MSKTGSSTSTVATITWNATVSTYASNAYYRVLRNETLPNGGVQTKQIYEGTGTSCTDSGFVPASRDYTYYVTLYNSDGTILYDCAATTPFGVDYTDVETTRWSYGAIMYVRNNGIMNGTTQVKFSPASSMTRAQTVMALWNMAGKPSTTGTLPFTDVSTSIRLCAGHIRKASQAVRRIPCSRQTER